MSTPTSPLPSSHGTKRRRTRLIAATAAAVTVFVLGLGGWGAYRYLNDASFIDVEPGSSSGTTITICTTGQAQYYGYEFTPTRAIRLTGAELVGVPDSFTVIGVYAVNLKQSGQAALGAGTQQNWDQMGYSHTRLYPVSGIELPAGGMGEWWLVAKVVPHEPGLQTIQGVKVSYTSGSRSGSTVLPERAISDCPK